MNLQQLAPWNWFKHEDVPSDSTIPINRHPAATNLQARNQHPVLQLHQELDRLFDQSLRSIPWFASALRTETPNGGFFQNLGFHPQLNIASDDKQYHISLEVPGLSEENLTLELNQNDTLTIRGEKSQEEETKDKQYYRVECNYGRFQRVLALPEDSDTDKLRATLNKGVLEIILPKKPFSAAQSATKKIPISNTHH
jgi:HSP20 family protein